MMAGRRTRKRETLRSLLAEDNPSDRPEPKDHHVISPPQTRNRTQQEKVNAKKLSPPRSGNQSPDPNCSICLGKLENKSFTDSCFHMFCFACLLEWSKVKAECPLCKQPFKSIIHNVRSYEDYDQYHIQVEESREQPQYPWESPEGYRFRYRTTVTFDHVNRFMQRDPDEQQRQLRLLQRPTRMTTRQHWRRRRQGATSEFRRHIYLNGMRVTQLTSLQSRQRKIGPAFYRNNPACTHRLVPWLNRELNALLHVQSEHVHFLLELIMDLIKRFDIDSEEFFEHLHSYLSRHTRHFIHEFLNFARSPYDMVAYDQNAVYEPYTETIESDSSSPYSSPGSDIIVVDEVVPNPEQPVPANIRRRKKNNLPSDAHNPEPPEVHRSVSPLVINTRTTAMSGWDSPTPGPSGIFASPLASSVVSSVATTTSSISTSSMPNPSHGENISKSGREVHPSKQGTETSDSDQDSDGSSVVIVKVEKPWHERTPITISSGSEEERLIKNEISGVQKEKDSRKRSRDEHKSSSGSGNSSSDLIDVVTVTGDKSHKKHKHGHGRGKKSHKRKHSEHRERLGPRFSRKSCNMDKGHSRSSKDSNKHESRKYQHERGARQGQEIWHLTPEYRHRQEYREHSPMSCVYGYEHSRSGKYGEFFQWLHYNEDRFSPESLDIDEYSPHYQRSEYSGGHGRFTRSRSRSESYETLWPNSSRSRSPSMSIPPKRTRLCSDKHSQRKRSRSSSVEIIEVVSDNYAKPRQKKSHKKHKKHKTHKHKHRKERDVECEDKHIEVVELEPPTEVDSPAEMQNHDDINTSNAHPTPSCSAHKSPNSPKKFKKHPTGHKTSMKSVKIKRDTPLMKSLQYQNPAQFSEVGGTALADNAVSAIGECSKAEMSSLLTNDSNNAESRGSGFENRTLGDGPCARANEEENEEIDVVTCDDALASHQKSCGTSSEEKHVTRAQELSTIEVADEELDVVSVKELENPLNHALADNGCSDGEDIDITSCEDSREEEHIILSNKCETSAHNSKCNSTAKPTDTAVGKIAEAAEIADGVIGKALLAKPDAASRDSNCIDVISVDTYCEDEKESPSIDKCFKMTENDAGSSETLPEDLVTCLGVNVRVQSGSESEIRKDSNTVSLDASHENQQHDEPSVRSFSVVNISNGHDDKLAISASSITGGSDACNESDDIDITSCNTSREQENTLGEASITSAANTSEKTDDGECLKVDSDVDSENSGDINIRLCDASREDVQEIDVSSTKPLSKMTHDPVNSPVKTIANTDVGNETVETDVDLEKSDKTEVKSLDSSIKGVEETGANSVERMQVKGSNDTNYSDKAPPCDTVLLTEIPETNEAVVGFNHDSSKDISGINKEESVNNSVEDSLKPVISEGMCELNGYSKVQNDSTCICATNRPLDLSMNDESSQNNHCNALSSEMLGKNLAGSEIVETPGNGNNLKRHESTFLSAQVTDSTAL